MSRPPALLSLICLSAWAQNGGSQNAGTPAMEAQAAALRVLVEHAPKLPLERTRLNIQSPGPGWELGYPSSVSKIIRSWGKGIYKIPPSIRIDPQGNIWTVDSLCSMVLKFTPEAEKLMEISCEQPAGRSAGSAAPNRTTDIAFGPNGRLFMSDGYGKRAGPLPATARDCGGRPGRHLRGVPAERQVAEVRSQCEIPGLCGVRT